MATYNMGFTYPPKIEAVKDERCKQSIRYKNKRTIKVGDFLNLFTWSGRPYRSKWSWRKKVKVRKVINIRAFDVCVKIKNVSHLWYGGKVNGIAKKDFIDPPTGVELRKVLTSMHGPLKGQLFQIIRW